MAIAPISGINSYSQVASVQPMSYAVEIVKAEPVEKERFIDPTAMLEQRRKTASAFNEIASQFRTANTGYSKAGVGNSYGLAGHRFDAFA